jgi:hypothetical protein
MRPNILHDCANGLNTSARPTVYTLELELLTDLTMDSFPGTRNYIETFFLSSSVFPMLEKLQSEFTNTEFLGYGAEWTPEHGDTLHSDRWGSFDMLLDQLNGIVPTLWEFEVAVNGLMSSDFYKFITPATSMAAFQNLEYLTLPQELLLGPSYGATLVPHATIAVHQLLPSSLRLLTLVQSTSAVFDWLDGVLDNRSHLWSLYGVNLVCGHVRGDTYWLMEAMGNIWREGRYVWFDLTVCQFHSPLNVTCCNGWCEGTCDPYMIRVILEIHVADRRLKVLAVSATFRSE